MNYRRLIYISISIPSVIFFALIFHYQVWLRTLQGEEVTIWPGKWVAVECHTPSFKGTIESIDLSGLSIKSHTNVSELPCHAVGIYSLGNNRYYFPFRTVIAVSKDGRFRWKNPFPI